MTILKKLKSIFILFIFFLIIILINFNTKSNIEFLFNQSGKIVTSSKKIDYKNDNLSIISYKISRQNESFLHKTKRLIFPSKIIVFEFDKHNNFKLFANIDNDFAPMTAKTALKTTNSFFAINTNFYQTNYNIIGELIINGINYGNSSSGSGFFKIINGIPYVGSRSMFLTIPGKIQYSCQAFPSVMKNSTIFNYIQTEKPPYSKLWKRKTYRNLIGSKPNGNICILVSNTGALLSVKEITMIAKSIGIRNASLFDGGRALQYYFSNGQYQTKFSVFNNLLSLNILLDKILPTKFKLSQKSPVYLTIK